MNRNRWAWLGALCAVGVWAGSPSGSAADAAGGDTPRPKEATAPAPAAAVENEADLPYLKSLMEHLKQERPAEYERLNKLRADNPEKFREALRSRLQELRKRLPDGGALARPEAGTPPRGDAQAARGKGDRGAKPDARSRAAAEVPHPISPEAQELQDHLRKLVTSYHAAKTDDERKAVENRIRETLSRSFEQRDRDRAQRIERMEQDLNRLREETNARKQNREDIINRKLDEVLGRAKNAW